MPSPSTDREWYQLFSMTDVLLSFSDFNCTLDTEGLIVNCEG